MSKRHDELYVYDILDSSRAIVEFTDGLSFETFCLDRKTVSAVIREFEIIGEAVGRLSDDLKIRYPQVAWKEIKGFRNMLAHEYFGVDLKIVWNTVSQDLPVFYRDLRKLAEENNMCIGLF